MKYQGDNYYEKDYFCFRHPLHRRHHRPGHQGIRKEGLRYEVKGKVHKADIKIIGRLENEDSYDFIFLTVKEKSSTYCFRGTVS